MLRTLALARARAITTASAAAVVRRSAPRLVTSTVTRGRRTYASVAPAATTNVVNYEPAKEDKHLRKVLIANR
jgi:hypothetical protein